MQPDTILCSRCGTANAAGDQFCGSCGAFLEWEGRARPSDEPPPVAEPAPSEPLAPAPPPTEVAAATAGSAATAAPDVPSSPAPQAGFSVCPHCGSGNPPGRTFCHKCGKLLAATPPAAAANASGGAKSKSSSGGLPGWLPIVIVVGLLVGAVAILVTVVFKPAPLPTAVGPSATLTPTLAVPPSITPGPASAPTASAPAASPAAPGESIQLTVTGATSSSVAADTPDVAPGNVIDGRLDTRWEEKVGAEPGEWVEITFAASRLDYLVIYNGFQLSHDSFVATKRPQNIVVTVNGGAPVGFMLADSETPQKLDVSDTPGATTVRIQVATMYPASASAYPGSPIDASAISEIRVFGSPGG
jgi:ribosomal protein L40E